MKKIIVALIVCCAAPVFSQVVPIDTAIANAVRDMSQRIPQGSQIAIINISSDYEGLSDHIINGLQMGLVNTGRFRVVPRDTIAVEAAGAEFDFQMDGFVSDDEQRFLGQALGADTIVTGTVVIGPGGTYRLTVNSIYLEGFFLRSSFIATFEADGQVRTIIEGVDVVTLERQQADADAARRVRQERDAEVRRRHQQDIAAFRRERGEVTRNRIGMGAMNMAFGWGAFRSHQFGDFSRGQHEVLGGTLAVGQALGTAVALCGLLFTFIDSMAEDSDEEFGGMNILIAGGAIYGAFALIGWIAPFVIIPGPGPRPRRVSNANIISPFDLELVSTNNRNINGIRVSRTIRF